MKEETAAELLARVIASPDDDEPRLVYADWLMERGDPRGEFIQLQCLLKNRFAGPQHWNRYPRDEGEPSTPEQARTRRVFELLRTNISKWLGPLDPALRSWGLHRGFLDSVIIQEEGVALLPRLFEREPVVDLTFSPRIGTEEALRHFLAQPIPPRVQKVSISKLRSFDALLAWPPLRQLRALWLFEGGVGPSDLESLAASPDVHELEKLSFVAARGYATDASLLALVHSPHLRKLRELKLRNVDLKEVSPAVLEECRRRFTLST